MITNEVSEVFREYLDLSNLENLRLVNSLNEASQNQFLVALTSKLYDKIQAKATKIDYSSVEYSSQNALQPFCMKRRATGSPSRQETQ